MAQASRLVKPATQRLIHLTVLRTQRLSQHWMRVTLGGGEIERFDPMGYDQWFRIFLPLGGDAGLERLPAKAHKLFGYLKYLRIPDGMRPVMRNYSVREFRPAADGRAAELDVDFVLHGSAADGTAGPASRWAETCAPGESVVIIDEGLAFNPERGTEQVLLIADETGLPAIASICASLPASATGLVIIEVPAQEDALEFARPSGIEVQWIVRSAGDTHHDDKPGSLALAALAAMPDAALPASPFHAYIVGEQSLPTGARRHLVSERGLDKDLVSFCGYWRVGAASPTPKSQIASNVEASA
ncbi:siderophore-interacting protein [Microbacterium pygmaeum]|uniref:NADPH-dependent ferric siderophore reductase, contains FAD-binding and SIP domains n=1 Tax=Microbacterium pygmaeum TaxID=370764 RepID=A0A1G7U8R0_9MICO|nr:siderophore-interacting protein [Microbacterium pygmaeum]SDG43804.1 NADPH-dependent ferric siderophore reductase, contains FAD-binding and SIP domains [Microbacterium pygmaeum]